LSKIFLSNNIQMRAVQSLLGQVGWSEAPVLIQGETGSGKEVFARELHNRSPRADNPFLKLNCAALPSELVESELFGYERGAFTGAFQRKAGMFEMANGGTILLDEIGDMDVRLQAKLLQVLQDQEFQRIGGKETIKVDARVMAATHCDLEKAISEKSFRQDLYYRLNVINLYIPPLRERKEDILPLAEFFALKHSIPGMPAPAIAPELQSAMVAHDWPGNVRELENVVRKLLALRDPASVARDLNAKIARRSRVAGTLVSVELLAEESDQTAPILEQVNKANQHAEAEAILAALNSTRWNRKRAAAALRIDYKALLYKMKKLGLENGVASGATGSRTVGAKGTGA
jgi:transcriptional regulator with PAS, ATPase and Fis domain